MIKLHTQQGSPEWRAARLGIPSASQFHRVMTRKTRKLSESSHGYMCELLAEHFIGEPASDADSPWMQRGTALEQTAVAHYEFVRQTDTQPAGFILRDDRRCGCSPDRLVGEHGALELKCPSAKVHVANLLDMTEDYVLQVQGGLWIAERDWWDLVSFNPVLPEALVRIERDDELIGALAAALEAFCDRLDEAKDRLTKRGCIPWRDRKEVADDSRAESLAEFDRLSAEESARIARLIPSS